MKILLFAFCLFFASCQKQQHYYVIAKDPAWLAVQDVPVLGPLNIFIQALMIEIAKKAKFKVNVVDISEFELYQGLARENYQGVLSTIFPDNVNLETYDFSQPFLLIGPVLVVREKDQITKLDDLKEKILGVPVYGTSIYVAQKVPNVIIKEYEVITNALLDLKQGEVDGVLMSTLLASSLMPKYKGELKIATPPLTNEAIRLLVLKGKNQKLLQDVDQTLKQLSDESKLKKLKEQFYLSLRQFSEKQRSILHTLW